MLETNSDIQATIITPCAICGRITDTVQIYPAQFHGEIINEEAFSARRFYDQKIHWRVVRCLKCGLWRSDPVIDPNRIGRLYAGSKFTYGNQTKNLERTYGRYLDLAAAHLKNRGRLLEIGAGSGFFLAEAKRRGFDEAWGIEPSLEAVSQAPESIKPFIKTGLFSADFWPDDYFDVICIFQTLEHFTRPDQAIRDCLTLLKPGGVVLVINHNISAWWPTGILGERSPVIDIEHLYFFDRQTMRLIFTQAGFNVRKIFTVFNRHNLAYLFSLLPLRPIFLKDGLITLLRLTKLDKKSVVLPIGNIGIIAQKPQSS